MPEVRKLAAILVADVVGYSRLARADEEGTLANLRALWSDLLDPAIAARRGRVVKRTGDGAIAAFQSVVDAVRSAVEIQAAMAGRNEGAVDDRSMLLRIGVHLGDVMEEADGDLMGDGVNVAARLEGVAAPGGICLSEDAWRQVKGRLELSAEDLGPVELKNIPEPIRVFSVAAGAPSHARAAAPAQAEAPRLSIVVLPFLNLGGGAEQDYFADGITESLTSDLSRIPGAFVIARNTAFTYKGKAVDVKQIGRDLNVRYVLEGSVQRGGNRVRVSVQLIDAETRSHLWGERFDKPLADLFDMQDEIVSRLANRLGQELADAEARRAEGAANPDSMDHYFLGLGLYHRNGAEFLHQARKHFDRALELDPDNADALVRRAWVEVTFVVAWLPEDRVERLNLAEADLRKALRLKAGSADAHAALGVLLMNSGRAGLGVVECERALALDRNLATAHAWIGMGKYYSGRPEETEGHILQALRISPRDAYASAWMVFAAFAKFGEGKDEEAAQWASRSIDASPDFMTSHFVLAAALVGLGRMTEAREAVRAGLNLNPTFTIARYRASPSSDNPRYLAALTRILDALRKAGVPEG
ncbi:MAG TPA: adenylate/guanylate cyclase domain-containing protein [Roseiarcus sp.]|jgi:TolB-like protein|nr:adenylate/guanylate cyclase domain-containing protein [Roseiarcus sp.]